MARKYKSVSEFLSKFTICGVSDQECMIWIGAKNNSGYGYIPNQTWAKDYGVKTAHRLSYTVYNGIIPANRVVRHTCSNRACINPKHLKLGSHLDNIRDRKHQGTAQFLVQDLSVNEILQIFDLSTYKIFKQKEIANIYSTSVGIVGRIKRQEIYF